MNNDRKQCWCKVTIKTKQKNNETAQKMTPFSLLISMVSLLSLLSVTCLEKSLLCFEGHKDMNRMFVTWCGQWLSRVTAGP
jgi:hypothetical protein